MMQDATQNGPAIIGFRQDRVGARLIGIVNILRLRELLDPAARFLWLSQPDGPYPDLADPAEIFAPPFVADVLTVIPDNPDLAGRRSLTAAAGETRLDAMQAQIAAGARWFSDAAFEMASFRAEPAAEVAAQTARLVAALPLAPRLAAARDRALARIGIAGDARPVAIHVRRGDILAGDPWSYTAWPSKYVPDEFFRAFLAETTGPVLAFSDTPAALTHLAQGDSRIVPVAGLLDAEDGLTIAQRDVLEMLLMARCVRVGAPSYSAFSRAAHVLGGTVVASLPASLRPAVRIAAYDALLDRAIRAPHSFFAPGDLAQSLHYAAPHAIKTGRGAELLDAFAGDAAFLDRFPFVSTDLATAALSADRPAEAARLSAAMLANPRLRQRDRINAGQIAMLGATPGDARQDEAQEEAQDEGRHEAPATPAPADQAGFYLSELFIGRRAAGIVMPRLGWQVLGRKGPASDVLALVPGTIRRLTAAAREDSGEDLLPPWIPMIGWADLVKSEDVVRRLRQWPPLPGKLRPMADLLDTAETAVAAGAPLPDLKRPEAEMLGIAASALILDNRLMRAMRLLEALAARSKGDAVARKRLADACFTAGNTRAGWRWLTAAHEAAPDNPLICLSAALRTPAQKTVERQAWLDRAEAAWPGLPLTARIGARLAARPKR